ncbi:hypothetical protein BH10ACI2_BH10ACI2_16820 [soil metagenome]
MPYFDDNGNEIDPDTVPLPTMCTMCEKQSDPYEEILCNLTRLGQRDDAAFKCEAFVSLYGPLIDDIIV